MSIFKTKKKGGGVKYRKFIPKGAFVIEYVGEVCSHEEIQQNRSNLYKDGTTYLYDLDYSKNKKPYVIDSTYYGNVSLITLALQM